MVRVDLENWAAREIEYFGVRRCPRRVISPASAEWLRLHAWREKGFLPGAGAFQAQSNRYIRAMEIIDEEYARAQRDQIKEMERQSKR